jgi:glycine cleavage system H protein
MSKEPKKESGSLTRREFLKEASLVAGGITIASLALQSACSSPNKTIASTTVQPTTTSTGYKYIPANTPIHVLEIPNSCCTVATDRLYSEEHVWVKSVADDIVAMGISGPFSMMIFKPNALSLDSVGTIITKGEPFGTIEGQKLTVDLTSPVSGTVIDENTTLLLINTLKEVFAPAPEGDTYGNGWMIAVRISNPAELNDILTPQQYLNLLAKTSIE